MTSTTHTVARLRVQQRPSTRSATSTSRTRHRHLSRGGTTHDQSASVHQSEYGASSCVMAGKQVGGRTCPLVLGLDAQYRRRAAQHVPRTPATRSSSPPGQPHTPHTRTRSPPPTPTTSLQLPRLDMLEVRPPLHSPVCCQGQPSSPTTPSPSLESARIPPRWHRPLRRVSPSRAPDQLFPRFSPGCGTHPGTPPVGSTTTRL